jgi:citronellol/citronellal dehydrogenase
MPRIFGAGKGSYLPKMCNLKLEGEAMNLKDKVIIITGSSRGIGRAIALRLAKDGAKIVIAAKSTEEGKLPGTIYSVAEEVKAAGGEALAIPIDLRFDETIVAMIEKTIKTFGRIDGLVNNAGAISLTPLEGTPMKKVDLMMSLNLRAVLACSHYCIPHLKKSTSAHILNLSPPLSLDPKWLKNHTPYTISKYGMSFATLGLAEELKEYKIAVNSLWPRTIIATAAIKMLLGDAGMSACREPEIMADAAYEIMTSNPVQVTGQCFLDEPLLRSRGYTDFEKYKTDPKGKVELDLYVEE